MKYLILIFITSLCFAGRGNYLAKEFINSGDTTGKPVFRLKDKCEAHYNAPCFDITGKPIAYNKVKQIELDDTSKPIYEAKSNVQACEGQACYELIQPVCEDEVCTNYCPDTYQAYVNETQTEVYCTKLTGYKQKKVDALVEDAALKAAYEQEKADKETAKQLKAAKKEAAKEWIKNCSEEVCLKLKDYLGIE